jgi:hypothetical protein
MARWYVYAEPSKPFIDVITVASIQTAAGCHVFDSFDLDGTKQDAWRTVEQRHSPIRVEQKRGETWSKGGSPYLIASGYEEAISEANSLAPIESRLVSNLGSVIPHKA